MTDPAASQPPNALKTCAVACLRAPYDPQAAAQAREYFADPAFDWPGFLQLVHHERISPLIHHHIGSWEMLPLEIAGSLRKVYLHSALLNSQRVEELGDILDRLQSASIAVILLKGAALMQTLYEKSALRPMADMDLLIHAEDMERGRQILLSCGYNLVIAASLPKEFESEVAFRKPGLQTWRVELHASLFNAPHRLSAAQLDWFWENTTTAVRNGRKINILSVESLLLHLSAHLWLHHGGGDLLGSNDIYQVIRQNQGRIDWEEILSVGREFEFLLPLQRVLPDLAANWNAPVPAEVLLNLSQMKPSVREQRKFNKFWGDDQNYAKTLLAGTMSYPDWKSRFRYARLILFPPAEYIKERYKVQNKWMVPFFYAYRLVSRAGQQVNRLIRKNAL